MRNGFAIMLVVGFSLTLCAGCASGPDINAAKTKEQPDPEPEPGKKVGELTDAQIGRIVENFGGIDKKHAADVWRAKEAQVQAAAEFEAYLELRKRGEDNQDLLSGAIRTHENARKLLLPLCNLYPHNSAINSMNEAVTMGLNALKERKK